MFLGSFLTIDLDWAHFAVKRLQMSEASPAAGRTFLKRCRPYLQHPAHVTDFAACWGAAKLMGMHALS